MNLAGDFTIHPSNSSPTDSFIDIVLDAIVAARPAGRGWLSFILVVWIRHLWDLELMVVMMSALG